MVNFKELEEEGYFITIDKRSKGLKNTKSIRNGKQKTQKIQSSGEQ